VRGAVSFESLTREDLLVLGRAAGLEIPEEDLDPLLDALRGYGRSFSKVEELDLDGVDPVLTYNPGWQQ
jgi:hypothetical protein